MGRNKWERTDPLFRGLPWQSIIQSSTTAQRGIILVSMWRWDAEKRRSGRRSLIRLWKQPGRSTGQSPTSAWKIEIRILFRPAPLLGSLNLRREQSLRICRRCQRPWNWSAGANFSIATFAAVDPRELLSEKTSSPAVTNSNNWPRRGGNWGLPEKKNTLNGSLSSEAGRIWSQPGHASLSCGRRLRFTGSRCSRRRL